MARFCLVFLSTPDIKRQCDREINFRLPAILMLAHKPFDARFLPMPFVLRKPAASGLPRRRILHSNSEKDRRFFQSGPNPWSACRRDTGHSDKSLRIRWSKYCDPRAIRPIRSNP